MASLIRSNKHLATSAQRQNAVRVTVATSSAIEGIHAPFKPANAATGKPAAAKLKRRHAKSA
jgi:hypothetical protein